MHWPLKGMDGHGYFLVMGLCHPRPVAGQRVYQWLIFFTISWAFNKNVGNFESSWRGKYVNTVVILTGVNTFNQLILQSTRTLVHWRILQVVGSRLARGTIIAAPLLRTSLSSSLYRGQFSFLRGWISCTQLGGRGRIGEGGEDEESFFLSYRLPAQQSGLFGVMTPGLECCYCLPPN